MTKYVVPPGAIPFFSPNLDYEVYSTNGNYNSSQMPKLGTSLVVNKGSFIYLEYVEEAKKEMKSPITVILGYDSNEAFMVVGLTAETV